jgi:hypothetical protein
MSAHKMMQNVWSSADQIFWKSVNFFTVPQLKRFLMNGFVSVNATTTEASSNRGK